MITASIAVGIILLISHKLGSLNMIVLPIVGGAGLNWTIDLAIY